METQYKLNGAVIPFSWKRVMMTGRFYWPDLKKQVILFPIITLICSVLIYNIKGDSVWGIMLIGNLNILLEAMFVFAPVALAVRQQRVIATMLPASARERFVFLALYFMVYVPLVIFGISYAVAAISGILNPDTTIMSLMEQAKKMIGNENTMINGTMWLPTSVCLLGVMYFKRNRALKSILVTIGLVVIYAIAISTYTMMKFMHQGLGNAANDTEAMDIAHQTTADIMGMTTMIGYGAIVLTLVTLWMVYRTIRNYQA